MGIRTSEGLLCKKQQHCRHLCIHYLAIYQVVMGNGGTYFPPAVLGDPKAV